MIKVQYYGLLRSLIGVKEEVMDEKKVANVIKEINKKYGKEIAIEARRSFVLVNGKNAALLKGYKTTLKDGDIVQIMPVTGGG